MQGWALVGERSPWQVAVTVDGRTVGSTSRFFTRPDVVRALGSTSPAGWDVPIQTAGLAAGEHQLRVLARACPAGPPLLVAERRVAIPGPRTAPPSAPGTAGPPGLAASARRAGALLAHSQQPAGYWLTSYTRAPRFDRPTDEMNTFLTATLVDLLDPLPAEAGLGEALGRARRHLTAQIEGDGLVRYHGLPDGPTIGWLGCDISPDADDTALVWRIAPGEKPDLRRRRSRPSPPTARPRACIAPGSARAPATAASIRARDPNPTDVVIQMHVLQLLARADPPAASDLCRALSRVIDEDRAWVYYRMAPAIPILRQSDLEKAGCALALPPSREHTPVSGQEVWADAARLLRRFTAPGGPPPTRDETVPLLRRLAADDFSALRADPPLVYHNDQSASTPRFYWSEDFGYAVWLRLFHAQASGPAAPGETSR